LPDFSGICTEGDGKLNGKSDGQRAKNTKKYKKTKNRDGKTRGFI
jgi:hypothetical protein